MVNAAWRFSKVKTEVCIKHGNSGIMRDLHKTALEEGAGEKVAAKLWGATKGGMKHDPFIQQMNSTLYLLHVSPVLGAGETALNTAKGSFLGVHILVGKEKDN